MVYEPRLIVQIPGGGALERQLVDHPPPPVGTGLVVVDVGATDAGGNLEATPGEVVLSVPAPAALTRDPDAVRRVLDRAGTGTQPLIVEVEAGEALSEAELKLVLDAAGRADRPVILRVIRNV